MTGSRPHTVLATADSEAFGSLRKQANVPAGSFANRPSPAQGTCPARVLGRWDPPADRPSPVQLIMESHVGRLEELVPIRVGRMVGLAVRASSGAPPIVMAEHFAGLPATGITPVICGDAHLGNFGFYASPEGELVLDLNDFDEAHPGSLGMGSAEAGSQRLGRGTSELPRPRSSAPTPSRPAWPPIPDEVNSLAEQPLLMRSYNRLDVAAPARDRDREVTPKQRSRVGQAGAATGPVTARSRDSPSEHEGRRHIVDEPPLITSPESRRGRSGRWILPRRTLRPPPPLASRPGATPSSTISRPDLLRLLAARHSLLAAWHGQPRVSSNHIVSMGRSGQPII